MKVMQTIWVSDPNREGNCLAACVATYLELPLEKVPHFAEYYPYDKDAWWHFLLGFMAGHGLWAYDIHDVETAQPDEVVFVAGMSERGVMHQVLYKNGVLWHDPHPSQAGILDVREVIKFLPATHDHTPT
jgi:hypothetical protein